MADEIQEIDITQQAVEDLILAATPQTLEQAICCVMAKIRWIGRTKVNGVNFDFLLEDKVLEVVQPEFLKYGITIAPTKVKVALSETFTGANGKVWNRVILTVKYVLTHVETGQSKVIASSGEGSDIGDKATAKAMTMAMKYAIRQAFFIRTGKDDPDKTSSEMSEKKAQRPQQEAQPQKQPNQQNNPVYERAVQAVKTADTTEKIAKYIAAAASRGFNNSQMQELKRLGHVRSMELGKQSTNNAPALEPQGVEF